MATQTLPEAEITVISKKPAIQYVYFFGGGKADGNGKMKDELGGKGAGLGRNDQRRLAGTPGLHDSDGSLSRVHAAWRRVEGS